MRGGCLCGGIPLLNWDIYILELKDGLRHEDSLWGRCLIGRDGANISLHLGGQKTAMIIGSTPESTVPANKSMQVASVMSRW